MTSPYHAGRSDSYTPTRHQGSGFNPVTGFASALETLFSGALTLIGIITREIGNFFMGVVEAIFPGFKSEDLGAKQSFVSGMLALLERTDLISPLLNFGSWALNSNQNLTGGQWTQLDFSKQVTPVRGMKNLGNGVIKLDAIGVWNVSTAFTINGRPWFFNSGDDTAMRIVVYDPDGNEFDKIELWNDQISRIAYTMTYSFVVEKVGCTVAVFAYSQTSTNVNTNTVYSRLVVQQITNDTDKTKEKGALQPMKPTTKEGGK